MVQNMGLSFKTKFKVEVDEGYSNNFVGWNSTVATGIT